MGGDVYGSDFFTEPEGDPDTLANLGPLGPMAGVWEGQVGADEHPVVEGAGQDVFNEHYEIAAHRFSRPTDRNCSTA